MKMRKWVLALVGLLFSAGACYAAFAIFQTALPSRTQVSLTSYGGACDSQVATRVTTITDSGSGLKDLAVTVNTFVSGDVGKTITIPGGTDSGAFSTTIAAFVDTQHITLTTAAEIGISASSVALTWGSNDSTAFLAFKAAFQGTLPVQLNMPNGTCVFIPVGGGSSPSFFPFKGVLDLVVSGNGAANTTLRNPNTVTGSLFVAGLGQGQNNRNSVRTNDASPGDSCITLKTTPAITISNIDSSLASPAIYTASISGTTMTVTAVASGTIAAGAGMTNTNSNTANFTIIQPYGTGGTTGVGGTGTYAVSISQSVASQTFRSPPATFTASVTNLAVMTVSAVADGTIAAGMFIFSQDGKVQAPQLVMPYGTDGTTGVGGTGTYKLNAPPVNNVSSQVFTSAGQPRVTVNSTAGLTSGDTLFTTGVTGQGGLPQLVDGLRWVKVVDGTHYDIFQSYFDGSYTSGGTGGGDRTSLFPVGSTVMMTGWSNQAYWAFPYGFPSNPGYFEYKRVTSTNSTTHQVCFDTPLIYTYKAAWPQMSTGSQFEVDPGGPATLYVLDPSWESTVEIKNLTLDVAGQIYANGRTVTYRDVDMLGGNCVSPSQNETHNWINVTGASCQIETDKLVVNWNVTNSSIRKVDIQSSSFVNVNVNGITATNAWFGSGKKMNMQNATITNQLGFGVTAYGASEETICSNCASGSLGPTGAVDRVDTPSIPWSMSGGVITIPNAYSLSGNFEYQLRNLVPGTYATWIGGGGGGSTAQHGAAFKVTSATQDFDNTYIQTSEVGGFPTGAWVTNGLSISPHPAPKLTTSGMSGNNISLSLNGCPAQSPMFSCQNFTYTGGASGTTQGYSPTLWGALDTFTFTNNVPYTNAGTLTWKMSGFDNWPVLKTDMTQVMYGTSPNGQNILNTKLPSSCGSCTRTLTSSGATNTQVGDTITVPPSGALFGGTALSGPVFSANTPSDSPQVTVTLRTNQNLP